jgi:hypothetical protein
MEYAPLSPRASQGLLGKRYYWEFESPRPHQLLLSQMPCQAQASMRRKTPLCLGLPLQLPPTCGKPQPFVVVRTECFLGHAKAHLGLLAIVCRQNPETNLFNGCHQVCPRINHGDLRVAWAALIYVNESALSRVIVGGFLVGRAPLENPLEPDFRRTLPLSGIDIRYRRS